jgi:hypothetical protein
MTVFISLFAGGSNTPQRDAMTDIDSKEIWLPRIVAGNHMDDFVKVEESLGF